MFKLCGVDGPVAGSSLFLELPIPNTERVKSNGKLCTLLRSYSFIYMEQSFNSVAFCDDNPETERIFFFLLLSSPP